MKIIKMELILNSQYTAVLFGCELDFKNKSLTVAFLFWGASLRIL